MSRLLFRYSSRYLKPVYSPYTNAMNALENSQDINNAIDLSQQKPIFIFKHSATCPFSARANREVMKLELEYPFYRVVVQQSRAVSNEIAERLAVVHQTPQIILLDKGDVKLDMSHSAITTDSLRAAMKELASV